jgi:hypothetical protein
MAERAEYLDRDIGDQSDCEHESDGILPFGLSVRFKIQRPGDMAVTGPFSKVS